MASLSPFFTSFNSVMASEVSFAVAKCPFLAKVAAQHGQEYAANLAVCPTAPAGAGGPPPGSDRAELFAESFRLFHGPQGIVPLVSSTSKPPTASGCPFHAQAAAAKEGSSKPERIPRPPPLPLATISLSFGSGPNFGDLFRPKPSSSSSSSRKPQRPPGHGHSHTAGGSSSAPNAGGPTGARPSSQHPASNPGSASGGSGFKPQRPLTDPNSGSSSAGGFAGNTSHRGWSNPTAGGGHGLQPPSAAAAGHAPLSSNPTGTGSLGASANGGGWLSMSSSSTAGRPAPGGGPQQHRAQPQCGTSNPRAASSSSSNGKPRGPGRAPPGKGGRLTGGSSSGAGASASGGTACPLRKWLGPMAGLVFNEYDKLVCPPPIVAARAALSRTPAVQTLRPQALPVKLVAVAAVAAAANLPCGAVREHFEKFSLGWFVAVHATIPFVAMLRKAVIMPKFAIAVTIGAAVLGQAVGARLERLRLQQLQLQQVALLDAAPAGGLVARAPLAAGVAGTAAAVLPGGSCGGRAAGVVREGEPGWREKLVAGAAAGFAALPGGQQQLGNCVREVVTGLGSLMPQLPVVRA